MFVEDQNPFFRELTLVHFIAVLVSFAWHSRSESCNSYRAHSPSISGQMVKAGRMSW